jgi:hypothetical protein
MDQLPDREWSIGHSLPLQDGALSMMGMLLRTIAMPGLTQIDMDRIAAEARAATEFPRWLKIGFAALVFFEVLVIAAVAFGGGNAVLAL